MVAITLQIMINAPTHALATPEKTAMRHRNGDVLGVHKTSDFATLADGEWKWNDVISSPRSVFVHVTDVPTNLAKKIWRLARGIKVASESLRVRRYRIPPSVVPTAFRDKLLADKEATITFTQAKTFIRKKVISNALDPSLDNEDTQLVDGDLL